MVARLRLPSNSLLGITSAMPRRACETRRRIVESAYQLFYREGFQRAGVDAVAETAGVTKRTLYNHFPSKDALIAEVLEAQADLAGAEIRRWCGQDSATPEELVGGIFAGLRRWARTPGWHGSGFTRAVMELAWAPGHPARWAAAAQKQSVEQMLAEALAGSGAASPARLARELVLLIEGASVLRLIHGDEAWFDAAEAAALALARGR
jgi:AcrR family transcriptional regulator